MTRHIVWQATLAVAGIVFVFFVLFQLVSGLTTVEVPVQVNGKVRSRILVAADADQATMEATALADPKVQAALGGNAPKKVIVVPGRMVNIVG